MAIYHLSAKPIQRSAGRSSTAASAYRAGEKITDERTGEVHDYSGRSGVESAVLVFPDQVKNGCSREELWNRVERSEKRKDSCVAREYELALPAELNARQRQELVVGFAREMADRHGNAYDIAIHKPGRGGDSRNFHAHVLSTTRVLDRNAMPGQKCLIEQAGRNRKADLELTRERWAHHTNIALAKAGHQVRVDHRSNEARGIEREAGQHEGPALTALKRRGIEPEVLKRRAEQREDREQQRLDEQIDKRLLDREIEHAGSVLQRLEREHTKPEFVPGNTSPAEQERASGRQPPERHRQREEGLQERLGGRQPPERHRQHQDDDEGPSPRRRRGDYGIGD